ncbi:MAG: hypothetical protein QW358_00380 [Candidatus Hadarchaeum sp.]
MSILVLTNIGSRDVLQNGEVIKPAREEGKRLLDTYDSCAELLTFPIVEPLIRYLLARHPEETINLYLFGTDQPDPKFQSTDTLYFTRLMARRLPVMLGERLHAQVVDVKDINPSYYDRAFEAYGRLLPDLLKREIATCYVALAGGVPACNTALLLQAVRYFGDRLEVLYTPIDGEPIPIRVGRQILSSFREAAALERLEQLDFTGALPLMRSLGASPGLCHLAEYAVRRLDFDFQVARHALEEVLAEGDEDLRDWVTKTLRHDLDLLLGEADSTTRLAALLRELNWNAAICWKHRRYADFLSRVYRFQEAALRYLIEKIFDLPTDMGPKTAQTTLQRWEEGIQARPELREYLEHPEKKIDWRLISRPVYKAMLSFAVEEEHADKNTLLSASERQQYAALLERVNALDPLVELRHRTIVGHDFQGVSEEILLKASPRRKGQPVQPPDVLDEIVKMTLLDPPGKFSRDHNPYLQIAQYLVSKLKDSN